MPDVKWIRQQAKRIELVAAQKEHAPLLYDIFTGRNSQQFNPLSRVSIKELTQRIARYGTSFSEQAESYRVFGKLGEDFFGTFVVKNIDWERKDGEIGFSLLEQWQGKGLGSVLVYKCVNEIFSASSITSLWATASINNDASKHLLLGLGFTETGLFNETFLIKGKQVKQVLYTIRKGEGVFNSSEISIKRRRKPSD